MIQDKTALNPDNHFELTNFLGPRIDVGPLLMTKISIGNSDVLHRFTYQALNQDECNKDENKEECKTSIELVHQRLGSQAEVEDPIDSC